ncbi:MAG: ABC transporter permease [Candidatus Aminicenantes bacterium]|nr:ABC transporter permease [Candidatus Aminicenantes bacterium]
MEFDLEKKILQWRRALLKRGTLEDGHITELETHLRDSVDSLTEEGIPTEEAFRQTAETLGQADLIGAEYFKTVSRGLSGRPPWTVRTFGLPLIFNYFKTAVRRIKKQKGYSLINISGLTVGMVCCILIFLWVRGERSFDRFFPEKDHIYRICVEDHSGGKTRRLEGSPAPLGPMLLEEYPEALQYCRVQSGWKGWDLKYEDSFYIEEKLAAVDPQFFSVFRFPFLYGNAETALTDRYSIVLTESLAKKCFGEGNPIGQILQLNGTDMKVTGVIEDVPWNSHLQFDYAFPAVNMTKWRESKLDSWTYLQFATYVHLRKNTDPHLFEKKINEGVKRFVPDSKVELFLLPLKDVHFSLAGIGNWVTQEPNPGNRSAVFILSFLAVVVLLIACINYMNLATARSSQRSREVGVRKIVGGRRSDILKQFFGESLVHCFTAFALALLLVWLFLPVFRQITGKPIGFSLIASFPPLLFLLGVVMLTGVVSGSYPALYLSSFPPLRIVRGMTKEGRSSAGRIRRALVFVQFGVTTVLIFITLVFFRQMMFIQNKDLGFQKDNLIHFAGYGPFKSDYETIRLELLQHPAIESVCRGFPPGQDYGATDDVTWDGKPESLKILFYKDQGDDHYAETFGIPVIQGRFYSSEHPSDASGYVINQAAARLMEMENPIGQTLTLQGKAGPIIGVVGDYNAGSLHHPIAPKVIKLSTDSFFMIIRYQPGRTRDVVAYLQDRWDTYIQTEPFQYSFVDEQIAQFYFQEQKTGRIFQLFTALAILVACLGLFGLAAFSAEQKTKEIGIRKVLGAGVGQIVFSMTGEFSRCVLWANLIAWPLAYILAHQWLGRFAYRITIGPGLFLSASLLAFLLAMAAVGAQTVRAASADPVKSLRYE